MGTLNFQGLRDGLNYRRNNAIDLIGNVTPIVFVALFCNTSESLSITKELPLLLSEVENLDRQLVSGSVSTDQASRSKFTKIAPISLFSNNSSSATFNTVLLIDTGDLNDSPNDFLDKTVSVTYNTATNVTLPFAVREGFRLASSRVTTPGVNTTVDLDFPISGSPALVPMFSRYTAAGYRLSTPVTVSQTNGIILNIGNLVLRNG